MSYNHRVLVSLTSKCLRMALTPILIAAIGGAFAQDETASTQSEALKGLSVKQRETTERLQGRGLAKGLTIPAYLQNIPSAAIAAVPPLITFSNAQRSPCYYRNHFFNLDVRATAEFSIGGGSLSPDKTGRYGDYEFLGELTPGPGFIQVKCDGVVQDFPVTIPNPVENFVLPVLLIKNSPPVISSFNAFIGSQAVIGATQNTVVELVAAASDPNNDKLSFTWASNTGAIISTTGNKARWQLPNSRGINFAYVVVTDGKGGYREANLTVSTDAGMVPATAVTVTPQPSDKVNARDHFLTFYSTSDRFVFAGKGADSSLGSCRYYVSIGAAEGCGSSGELINPKLTLLTWKQRWGLQAAGAGVQALYVNKADLNRERNMHGITTGLGTAFYVCNHVSANDPTLSNAINNNKLITCAAMEYSTTPGQNNNLPFTKFYSFDPSGALIQSVNLDGRGEKFLPGSCVVCHGARHTFTRFEENGSTPPNFRAQFLPFDLNNFVFSTNPVFSKANQEAKFRQLNQLVLDTKPAPAIVEYVKGSHPTPTSNFVGNFVPAGWSTHASLYNSVVKPYCRTCHLALVPEDPNNGLAFQTFEQFRLFNFEHSARVCGLDVGVTRKRYSMPNSLVTFNLLWSDATAIAALKKHLVDELEILPTDKCVKP
jgi:hypothetical protein